MRPEYMGSRSLMKHVNDFQTRSHILPDNSEVVFFFLLALTLERSPWPSSPCPWASVRGSERAPGRRPIVAARPPARPCSPVALRGTAASPAAGRPAPSGSRAGPIAPCSPSFSGHSPHTLSPWPDLQAHSTPDPEKHQRMLWSCLNNLSYSRFKWIHPWNH